MSLFVLAVSSDQLFHQQKYYIRQSIPAHLLKATVCKVELAIRSKDPWLYCFYLFIYFFFNPMMMVVEVTIN